MPFEEGHLAASLVAVFGEVLNARRLLFLDSSGCSALLKVAYRFYLKMASQTPWSLRLVPDDNFYKDLQVPSISS